MPTYGGPGTDFPGATRRDGPGRRHQCYASYQLRPDTVYYLLPGVHVSNFQADEGDAFVGGLSGRTATVLSGNYSGDNEAIDSNLSDGEPVRCDDRVPDHREISAAGGNAAAINTNSNTGWDLRYDTITLNAPGAGVDRRRRGQSSKTTV